MDLHLTAKRVVVTGAAGGIGLAIVQAFVAEGCRIVAADIATSSELTAAVAPTGGLALVADLGTRTGPPLLIASALDQMGGIDILVNNLGISPHRRGFVDASDDDWQHTFEVNLMSAVRSTREALPALLKQGGVIVSLASALGREPTHTMPDYCSLKAATLALTRMLGEEFSPRGVRAVAISPGPTLTPQWTSPGGNLDAMARSEGVTRDMAERHLVPRDLRLSLGRMATSAEIAAAVVFAASPVCGAMTGSEIVVDAGMLKAV